MTPPCPAVPGGYDQHDTVPADRSGAADPARPGVVDPARPGVVDPALPSGAPDPDLPRTRLDGAAYHRDPYPLFAQLRAAGEVHPVQFPAVHAWLITGYSAARQALTNPRLGKNHHRASEYFLAHASVMPQPQRSQLQVHLLHVDGERHRRMRSLVLAALTHRAAEENREGVRRDVAALIDALPPQGPVDLMSRFAVPLALRSLARAIGLPDHLRDAFDPAWGSVVAPVGPDHPQRPVYTRRLRELQDYIAEVVAASAGQETLLGSVVDAAGLDGHRHPDRGPVGAAAAERGGLTVPERDSVIFQLLVAGQDPVAAQLSLAVLALLERPELLDRLGGRAPDRPPLDPAMLVEELLRYDSAFNLTTWRFLADFAGLHDQPVPPGDSVIVALGAANRDPGTFPEPDAVDPGRTPNPHLAFGLGPHTCPGAALARVELQEALVGLAQRLPGLALAVPHDELTWSPAPLTRGVSALPVRFERRTA